MTVDKATLLAVKLPEAEVEIPDVGTVRVRGLSHGEVLEATAARERGRNEAVTLAFGLVEPTVTEDEAAAWLTSITFGQVSPILIEVMRLSGFGPSADKETWKELESEPGAEFRDVPGFEVGDDGDPAADGGA